MNSLKADFIYAIKSSPWVSPIHVVPKNKVLQSKEKGEEVQAQVASSWRVCIDYRNLNSVTKKNDYLLLFTDQILENILSQNFNCFLNSYS